VHSGWVPPSELATFRLARFRLRLKAKETLYLPTYKGSALRGGFGQVFRRIACPNCSWLRISAIFLLSATESYGRATIESARC